MNQQRAATEALGLAVRQWQSGARPATHIETQCAWCRRWRGAGGEWTATESSTPGAAVSHGICPACLEKFETEWDKPLPVVMP